MFKCSHPNCNHLGSAILNRHCVDVHGMTKKEMVEKYGEPTFVQYDNNKRSMNLKDFVPYVPVGVIQSQYEY